MTEPISKPPTRDWKDEHSYRDLERLDRRGFAWEYLRRNPEYRNKRDFETKGFTGSTIFPEDGPAGDAALVLPSAGDRAALGQCGAGPATSRTGALPARTANTQRKA